MLKGLSTPIITYISNSDYGGSYNPIDNYYDDIIDVRKRPVIQIDADSIPDISSGIAHEFRHHWQLYTYGWGNKEYWTAYDENISYDEYILNYYLGDRYELDALIFECKYAPNDNNLSWLELVVKYMEIKCKIM
jgi:hypothetical protein